MALFFAFLAFMEALGANISKVRMVFTMQYFLVTFVYVPIKSNVTKGFIKEMHIDIVL